MTKYHVTYYYLATGMEGRADTNDYGYVEAESAEEAEGIVAMREVPTDVKYGPNNAWSGREFFRGCLKAKETRE